jgi:hypothetical protein
MTSRQARELLEVALDGIAWQWCRAWSLLISELIAREESGR